MNGQPTAPVTVYWRPGCGFCHILRRELDRAGVERTEINIWDDPAAASVVRSHARGTETVPTVLVGDLAMVNPDPAEVIAARDRRAGSPTEAGLPGRSTEPAASDAPWLGMVWTVAACALWGALAMAHPTTTYHLAPVVAILAWPLLARSRRSRSDWRPGLLATAGATALVAMITLALHNLDALAGPALIGPNATTETAVLTALAALVALALARPRRRPIAALRAGPDGGRRTGGVAVVESGDGCATALGAGEGADQCAWTPGPARD